MWHRKYQSTGHRSALYALSNSHEAGKLLAAGGDGWVSEWNMDNMEVGHVLAQVDQPIFSMAVSPPDWPTPMILAGNMIGGLHWINRAWPEQTKNLLHHRKGIYGILWHESQVFTVGGDGVLTRWDAHEQRPLESIQLSLRPLRCLAYSPVLDVLAIGASDGHIYYVSPHSMTLKGSISAHENSIFTLVWGPNGQKLYSSGRDAQLKAWAYPNINTLAIPAHGATVNHLAFSPDGQYLASASRDKSIRIWALPDMDLVKVLNPIRDQGHINSVNHLVWNATGLFSCSDDRTIIFWHVY